jgi:hypothetical protein
MEQVGRRHGRDRIVQVRSIKRRGRHGHCGFQSRSIPNSRGPSISLDLVLMNFQDLVERQKDSFHAAPRLLGELLEGPSVSLVGPLLSGFELLSPDRSRRRDNETLPVRADL